MEILPGTLISVLSAEKKSEPYSISTDGHFVGCDGFVVPKNFEEFYAWEPLSVRRFLMKKLHHHMADEALLDMEQDLLLYLHHLPESSKHRKQGKTDVIMCFDPEKHHGASAKRFHNYLALCMYNRFCGIFHKQKKNPVYNKTNLSIVSGGERDGGENFLVGEATDEYIHANSSSITAQFHRSDGEIHLQKIFLNEFKAYVGMHAPRTLPVIEAIASTSSLKDARQMLAVNSRSFEKHRETLDLLRDCFLRGEDFALCRGAAKIRRKARIRAAHEAKKAKKTCAVAVLA